MGGEYHRPAFGASRQSVPAMRAGPGPDPGWRRWSDPGSKPRMRVSLTEMPVSVGLRGVDDVRFKDLLDSWRQTAAGVRTVSEYAVRLPVDDAARLHALAELFPGRTTEQIITDLLGAALQEVAAA